jgi:hypothetical protein
MMHWLYYLTGWRIFAPSVTPWGESTRYWSDIDWQWYRERHGSGERDPQDCWF